MSQELTVIIPCKNERANIRQCVESATAVANEILVADSGSTDGTLEILRSMGGCRIVEREYVHSGDFKNWAIPQARHPWVLILDADERITQPLAHEINKVLAAEPALDGYHIFRKNYFLGHRVRYSGWQTDSVLRLFRRDLGRYVGETDHAEVQISSGRVGRLRERLEHFSFWSYDQFLAKMHRYTTFQARQWNQAGRPVSLSRLLLSGPMRFAWSYFVRGGFLDGMVGVQICMLTGYYSFLKQARLWELQHAKPQPDPEAEQMTPKCRQRDAA